jgi:hypothetical protein
MPGRNTSAGPRCKCGCGRKAPKGRDYYNGHKRGAWRTPRPCKYAKCQRLFVPCHPDSQYCRNTCAVRDRPAIMRAAGLKGARSPKRKAKLDAMVAGAIEGLNPLQAYRRGRRNGWVNGWRSGYYAALFAVHQKDPTVLRWARHAGLSGVEAWARRGEAA